MNKSVSEKVGGGITVHHPCFFMLRNNNNNDTKQHKKKKDKRVSTVICQTAIWTFVISFILGAQTTGAFKLHVGEIKVTDFPFSVADYLFDKFSTKGEHKNVFWRKF